MLMKMRRGHAVTRRALFAFRGRVWGFFPREKKFKKEFDVWF